MRNTLIFAGNSCPALTGQICENLGMIPADAELTQFSNVSFLQLFIAHVLSSFISTKTNYHQGRDECQNPD